MEKIEIKNDTFIGSNQRKSLIDLEVPSNFNGNLILFVHGYMGFKDWGAWNLMQNYFVNLGFGFCKFNFSHNGGTIENGIDFPDLEAFAQNTYSKELYDLKQVLNYLESKFIDLPQITIVGHSRGGGITLLTANDARVAKIVTLAAISSIEKRFSDENMIESWRKEGVRFVKNQRTLQEMPHNFEQYLDFKENESELSISSACKKIRKPILIFHGDNDFSVPISEGEEIALWTNSELQIIKNADHVFGAKQPWGEASLPTDLEHICRKIADFIIT
jgi:pimeloyl-ACP methyl ester carboxylesterase